VTYSTIVVVGVLVYIFLWVLALNGAQRAAGAAAHSHRLVLWSSRRTGPERYLGIEPRKQHFKTGRRDEQ
jgi:hypothetical protein